MHSIECIVHNGWVQMVLLCDIGSNSVFKAKMRVSQYWSWMYGRVSNLIGMILKNFTLFQFKKVRGSLFSCSITGILFKLEACTRLKVAAVAQIFQIRLFPNNVLLYTLLELWIIKLIYLCILFWRLRHNKQLTSFFWTK